MKETEHERGFLQQRSRQLLKRALVGLFRNRTSQRFLGQLVVAEQWLMGIGSGGDPTSSGEDVLIDLLRKRYSRLGKALVIFDVGANKGQFLDVLDEGLKGTGFHVHAFEPGTAAFQALTAKYGSRPEVTLNNTGLGREQGSRNLYYDESGSGLASLYARRLDHFGKELRGSEMVRIESIETYCKEHGIGSIDLLKLDVEGHELDVLEGAAALIGKGQVSMITFEFGGCNIDSRTFFQDFYYFFARLREFRLFRITPSGYLAPIDGYREVDEQFRTTNFLAVRNEEDAARG